MGVPSEKFDDALREALEAIERAGDHLEWTAVTAASEDLAAGALMGARSHLLDLQGMRNRGEL